MTTSSLRRYEVNIKLKDAPLVSSPSVSITPLFVDITEYPESEGKRARAYVLVTGKDIRGQTRQVKFRLYGEMTAVRTMPEWLKKIVLDALDYCESASRNLKEGALTK